LRISLDNWFNASANSSETGRLSVADIGCAPS
jgi:hypothetical protein